MKNAFKQNALRFASAKLRAVIAIAVIAVIGFTTVACDDGNGGGPNGGGTTYVSFQSLTQNGSSSRSTTELTLRFDRQIPGLRNSDITIRDVDGPGRFYGTLSGSNPYYMSITAEASGNIEIIVEKSGYTISPSSRTVYIYYAAPTPTYSLSGSWQNTDGFTVYFSGSSTGTITQFGSWSVIQDAVSKGYVHIGDQAFKNLTQTGERTWEGETLGFRYNKNVPNVCNGTSWNATKITMSTDAQTFQTYTPGFDTPNGTWKRR
jgi:hypothetical protein